MRQLNGDAPARRRQPATGGAVGTGARAVCIGALVGAMALPAAVAAQDSAAGSAGWSRAWQVTAAPTFGADRAVAPFPVGKEIIDESEFGAGLEFERAFRNGATLTFAPGASYNPNQFDAEEPASALSFSTTFRAPVTQAVKAPDKLSWILSHSVRADFDEGFEDYVRTDQTFGLGLEFTNILTMVCKRSGGSDNGDCAPGWKYAITPSLAWVESTDHDRERFNPALSVSMAWPMGEFSSFYVKAAVDRRLYERVDAPNGDQLRDMRYAATAGVDLSAWTRQALTLPKAFTFRLGVRWSAVSSNDATRDSDQVYLVPELGWKQEF